MNENDALLDFLTDDLHGKQRDAVTRAFYQYSSGDPNSAPVGMAVLLTACARKVVPIPEEVRKATADLKKVMAEASEAERRVVERVDRSNASVISAFKDETARAIHNLRVARDLSESTIKNAMELVETTRAANVHAETLATQLRLLTYQLTANNASAKEIAQGTKDILATHKETKTLVDRLTDMAGLNWMTVGVVIGGVLVLVAQLIPPWVGMSLYALAIGLLQWIGRMSWNYLREEAKKISPPTDTKPPG